MKNLAIAIGLSLFASLIVVACHADPEDAAGQAEELADPVRRQNAINNLQKIYSKRLQDNDGDRSAAAVQEFATQVCDKLTQAYIDNPMDTQNGLTMLDLMKEMRDACAIPALTKALDWRQEVSEEHAIRAAQTIQFIDVPEGEKAALAQAIGTSLDKVRQARGIDNRMRIEMIRALGSLESTAATPILTKVATAQTEEQNFLINRLAAQQIGQLGDPAAVDAMINGLYIFAPNNPAMRMNDVAAESLVRIGRPSLEPLLAVLRGENEEVNAIAQAYIEAVRQRNAEAAEAMSVRQTTGSEATYALGSLGFREAMDPLMAETQAEDAFRKVNGAIALVRLNHAEGDVPRVRQALLDVYNAMEDDYQGVAFKAQLIAGIRSLYDPETLPFLLAQGRDTDQQPGVRLEAVTAYALLANKDEMARLTTWLAGAESDAYYQNFVTSTEKAVATANECDENIECYIGKLNDAEQEVVRKAAFMLGRLGRGNDQVIAALVDKLSHQDAAVRLSAVAAIDRVAVSGSQAAIDKIDELREREEGRAIWNEFSREALPIQARLRARLGG